MIDSTGGWMGEWPGGWLLLKIMIALASLEAINTKCVLYGYGNICFKEHKNLSKFSFIVRL